MQTAAKSDGFEWDPFTLESIRDPMRSYKQLRDEHPVYYIEKYDTFVLSRFQDVMDLLSIGDNVFVTHETTLPPREVFAKPNGGVVAVPSIDHPMPTNNRLGSPHYEQIRLSHIAPLRPKNVAQLEEMVRRLANERLDELLPQGTFEINQNYGGMVAASVACDMFNIPISNARKALTLVNASTTSDPNGAGLDPNVAFTAVAAFLLPAIEARHKAGADGSVPVIDGLIHFR